MKSYFALFVIAMLTTVVSAQKPEYNVKKGYVAEGYDVVSYFQGGPLEGDSKYSLTYDGVQFKFANEENMKAFKMEPTRYVPQYGGWCAYAVAENNSKVGINPESYEIRDGKLYLFYNAFFTNTLESWLEAGPEELRDKADENWEGLKSR